MKKRAKIATAVAVGVGASYLSYKVISEKLFNNTFKSERVKSEVADEYKEWFSTSKVFKVSIKSFDGLKLCAYKFVNHEGKPFILMVHGISNNKEKMFKRAVEFDKLGYNLLIIDLRGHGESEGEFVTYGLKESLDILLWNRYLYIKHPESSVILYGVSLGAASVMMATNNHLDSNVKCVVEDCGYSSFYEELDHVLKRDYKLQATGMVLKIYNNMMKERFGFTFEDISPKMCLENNEIPILFVHGMEDDLVPFEMATILYNHNKGEKKYYPVPEAKHAKANDNKDYYTNIDSFIKNYVS